MKLDDSVWVGMMVIVLILLGFFLFSNSQHDVSRRKCEAKGGTYKAVYGSNFCFAPGILLEGDNK